jgi:hypothetical protein
MWFSLAVVMGLVISWPLTAAAQTSVASFTADKPAPQAAFTNITFTATGSGGTTPYSFKFWLSSNGGLTWVIVRDWQPANTFLWGPATANEKYQIAVGIRSAGNTSGNYEDTKVMSFPIVTACFKTPGKTPDQDLQRGQCLFNSTVAWGQATPSNMFASCNGCHPGGGTDRGTHPVKLTNGQGSIMVPRQVPDLRNVTINVPLGWDGRHGGKPGDMASIKAAIQSAAVGAITSPVEMAGTFNPSDPVDQEKMTSLVAFLVSRSPTQPSTEPGTPPMLDVDTANNVRIGAAVFFGRSASTQALLAQGKACVSCHPAPAFTDNLLRTNVLNPSAAFDFGFPSGPSDTGAAFITGDPGLTGFFKTPSLHHFYPNAEPFMHNGIFGSESKMFQFYEKSLGFKLGPGESTGLHYWLVNCPKGIGRSLSSIPPECN